MDFEAHTITRDTLRTWYAIRPSNSNTQELCEWCILHKSEGKFYFSVDYWYFKLESDALLFALKWG